MSCVLFSKVFCVKRLCLLCFHHDREVFQLSQHLVMCVVNWPSNHRDKILPHSLRNVTNFIEGVKWVAKRKLGTFSQDGFVVAPNAVRHYHCLERTIRPLSWSLFGLTNITAITSKSKHTVKYPNLPSAIRPVSHSVELPVLKPLKNLTFSDNKSHWWWWQWTARRQSWLQSNIWPKLFLIWTPFINTKRY